MKRSFQKSLSLFLTSFLLVLPGFGERKESSTFYLQKSIILNKDNTATFPIKTTLSGFDSFEDSPELVDSIDPGAILETVYPEPDYFWEKGIQGTGYPAKSDYGKVKKLSWIYGREKKWQQESTASRVGYQYNTHYREDLTTFPEATLTDHWNLPLEKATPLLQVVEGKQWLFVSLAEGSLMALDPRTLQKHWEYKLPLGESITEGFVTFLVEDKAYILCVTNKSKLLLINAVDGAILWKTEIEGRPVAPMQLLTWESHIFVSLMTDRLFLLLEPYHQKIVLSKKISLTTPLSPLMVQVPGDFSLITAYPSGVVEAWDRTGKTLWSTQLKGEIQYDPSAVVSKGTLSILVSTTEKNLYWMDGLTGLVKGMEKLPGVPRSQIALAGEGITYSLIVSQDTPATDSFFYSGSFENSQLPRIKIPVPGSSFLGIAAIRTKYNECYYLIGSNYSWTVINKAVRFLPRIYPKLLLTGTKPMPGFLTGRDIVLCEGAILVNLQQHGLLILGNPYQASDVSSLQSGASNLSDDFSGDSVQFSGGRSRTDLDTLPEPKIKFQKKWDISPHDNYREIISPQFLYLEKQKKEYIIIPGKNGKVSFLNRQGDLFKQFDFTRDAIFTQPVIVQNPDGSLYIYVLSEKSLLKAYIEPTLQKTKIVWQMDDMGSWGSSFNLVTLPEKKILLLVDTFSYLTSVDEDTAEINFRVKVDAYTFALSKHKSIPYVYCGSKMVRLTTGKEEFKEGSSGSESTVVGALGTTFLLQSDDLDMTCQDVQTREIKWRVRKLWCKRYCFGFHAPAIYRREDQVLSYWSDYKRVICVDVLSGMIRWIYVSPDDFFHSKPSVAVVEDRPYVYVGSILGILYAIDGLSGVRMIPYPLQLPGKEELTDSLKGLSSPVIGNGCMLISRTEFGFFYLGDMKPPNLRFNPVFITLRKKEKEKKSFIFNRAILYWDSYYTFSQRVIWKITEGIPIIFLTFSKKMKKLM